MQPIYHFKLRGLQRTFVECSLHLSHKITDCSNGIISSPGPMDHVRYCHHLSQRYQEEVCSYIYEWM